MGSLVDAWEGPDRARIALCRHTQKGSQPNYDLSEQYEMVVLLFGCPAAVARALIQSVIRFS